MEPAGSVDDGLSWLIELAHRTDDDVGVMTADGAVSLPGLDAPGVSGLVERCGQHLGAQLDVLSYAKPVDTVFQVTLDFVLPRKVPRPVLRGKEKEYR